jgi:hypothetical protein
MKQNDQESVIVESFAILYRACRAGILNGNITPAQTMDLVDKMAGCFRDYLVLQQSGLVAQQAIQKAKDAA